jgi:hypothetical protein
MANAYLVASNQADDDGTVMLPTKEFVEYMDKAFDLFEKDAERGLGDGKTQVDFN